MRRIILAILLFAPLWLAAQTTPPAPAPAPSPTPPPAQPGARGQVQGEIDEEAIEKAIEQSVDEKALERKIEQHIDRIAGQINPREWRTPAMLGILMSIIVSLAFFALVALLGWLFYRRSKERMQARMDLHTQLLAKFNSGQEFSSFLASDGGRQFVESLWTPKENVRDRIMRSIQWGIIATALGLGMVFIDGEVGVIFLAIGIGYLISAATTWRLSKQMGLLEPKNPGSPDNQISTGTA